MHKLICILLLVFTCALGCIPWARLATAEEPAKTPETPLPAVKINPKDGVEMMLVPAGEFVMGTSPEQLAACLEDVPPGEDERKFQDELPQHTVYLDAYYIYKTELTVAQYRKFCQETNRQMPGLAEGTIEEQSIVNVSWEDAAAYAQWAGAELPTEAQWEKAARGTDGRIYPWGNDWDAGKRLKKSAIRADASPYGCLDMAGNAREWCADWYDANYYKTAPAKNPTGPAKGTTRVLRSGSGSLYYPYRFRTAYRDNGFPMGQGGGTGFRCVMRVPEPEGKGHDGARV